MIFFTGSFEFCGMQNKTYSQNQQLKYDQMYIWQKGLVTKVHLIIGIDCQFVLTEFHKPQLLS